MKFALAVSAVLACGAPLAAAFRNSRMRLPLPPAGEPPVNATNAKHGFFQQLIDHDNPSLGKFSQFYYWDDFYYKGPGSPVVLFTPGEIDVTNYYTYLTTNRSTGVIAKELGAATIVLEHRYWGKSSPYSKLSTENMQFLTLKNAIADLNYFGLNAKLPFDKGGKSNADKAPWVLVGGSYSGALTAWTEATSKPSVMWAYYASSAVVQAIGNYWQYFTPEQMYMPKNCSTDIARVIEKLDDVFEHGTLAEQQKMKTMFGFEDLPNYDDFMEALVNGPYLWQGNQLYTNEGFFEFCDVIEGATKKGAKLPGASGIGLDKALQNYAKWTKEDFIPNWCKGVFGYYSGKNSVECFDTYNKNSPMFTDMSLTNTYDRQWDWMLCNEPFGWWQNGAPPKQSTIVSRLIDNKYWTRQCSQWYPKENGFNVGIATGKKYNDVNEFTGGWGDRKSKRLVYVNGQFDPWRQSTVSSTIRPGGPMQSTLDQPVFVVPDGYHTSDLIPANGAVNKPMAQIQAAVTKQIKEWVKEFPSGKE